MGLLGGFLNTATKAIGTAWGLSKAANEMNQSADIYKQGKTDAYIDRDKFGNEDATQRVDAVKMLSINNQLFKDRNQAALRTAAVAGGNGSGWDEYIAGVMRENAKAQGDAAADIAVAGAKRKDEIQDAFQKRKDAYDMAEADLHKERAGQITKAVGNLWNTTSKTQQNMG